jgi:hypothetical protein
MSNLHTDQTRGWTGKFRCDVCDAKGTRSSCDGGPDNACAQCDGTGELELDCELRYDIDAGTPESGLSGPPENYDPGCGPEINKIAAFIDGVDVTERCVNIDDASELMCETWEPPAPDYPDYGPEDL